MGGGGGGFEDRGDRGGRREEDPNAGGSDASDDWRRGPPPPSRDDGRDSGGRDRYNGRDSGDRYNGRDSYDRDIEMMGETAVVEIVIMGETAETVTTVETAMIEIEVVAEASLVMNLPGIETEVEVEGMVGSQEMEEETEMVVASLEIGMVVIEDFLGIEKGSNLKSDLNWP